MSSGKIQYSDVDGAFVLKLIGDVRLTFCPSLDAKLATMLDSPDLKSVVIDLCEAQGIDSTSLGLLARLSLQSRDRLGSVPTILSTNADINRILSTMGFAQVFVIATEVVERLEPETLHDLPCEESTEQEVMDKVLLAHTILMDMNDCNHEAFCDLVSQLKKDCQVS